MLDKMIAAAIALRAQRYADAMAVLAAGSFVRGEATAYSDLDLVVVFPRLERAYRESFRFEDVPVEAFVHDPETLCYFYFEIDGPSGYPPLPQMVAEGVAIPEATDASQSLKREAEAFLAAGPPPLSAEDEQRRRYAISDLVDDLRDPRSNAEAVATGARLYEALADYHLRCNGKWSAKGKSIPRILKKADAELCDRYCKSFDELFRGDPNSVIQLVEDILRPRGGLLFDGYTSHAPTSGRKPPG